MAEAKLELDRIIRHPQLQHAVMLVFANKHDTVGGGLPLSTDLPLNTCLIDVG